MALPLVVPEIALWAFLGAYLTQTIGFSFTLGVLLWFYNEAIAIHRTDPVPTAELFIDVNFTTAISLLFGTALGLINALAWQFVPRLRWEFWRVGWTASSNSARHPVYVYDGLFTWFALAGALGFASFNFLFGHFEPEVSHTASLVIGIIGLLIAIVVAIYVIVRWARSDAASDHLNLIYTLGFVFIVITPALYDFLHASNPINQIAFHIALIIVIVVFAAINAHYVRFDGPPSRQVSLRNDVRAHPSQATKGRIWAFWLILWANLLLIYLAAGITDSVTGSDLDSVAIVLFLTVLIIAAIAVCVGAVRWRKPEYSDWWISRSGQRDHYDFDEGPLLSSSSAVKSNTKVTAAVAALTADKPARAASAAYAHTASTNVPSSRLSAVVLGSSASVGKHIKGQ